MIESLVDAAAERVLTCGGESVLGDVPECQDEDEDGGGDYEVPKWVCKNRVGRW